MVERAKSFRALSTEVLTCRAFNHSWDVSFVEIERSRSVDYIMTLDCIRCGTRRVDRWSSRGQVNGRRYEYVDNYLVADRPQWGSTRTFNRNVKQALVARIRKTRKE